MAKQGEPSEIQDDVWPIRQRVLAEAARFRAKLPQLLPRYADQWVVFRDDEVISAHATEEEAYVAGLKRFGPDGGHVVVVVREPENVVLSAAVAFGF
ncbi:MAG: hypothetical protein E6J90_47860 [Deltaproteobacteria bacterium]|nr:MAG: hypothetical protein E6J90_47860 [Deltaproteobacteria bacterium]